MRKDLNAGSSLRAVMQQHHLALEQAIRQELDIPPPERAEIALFFQELIDGGWDAYEEATAHESEELRKEDREIIQLQEQIRQLLDSEGQRQFDRYEDCLNCRMTSELDQAYLVGYQTAIRLLLMGILPADTLLARNAWHEPEKEGEKT